MEEEMKFREFIVRGRVYSPNESVANHRVYWAIRNSEHEDVILIDEVNVSRQVYSMVMTTIECPNHEGSFDCTPFCRVCEGEQEILYLASQE